MTKSQKALLYVSRGGKIRICGWTARRQPKWYCVEGGGAPVEFRFSKRVLFGHEFITWFRLDKATREYVLSEKGQFEASKL